MSPLILFGAHFDKLAGKVVGGVARGLSATESLLKTVAHGIVGGAANVAAGGKFLSGFASAGFVQGFEQVGGFESLGLSTVAKTGGDVAKNAIASAVIGGTASALGGGKFKNGAITGAFSRLFNDLEFTGKKGVFRDTETGKLVDLRRNIQQTPEGYLAEQSMATSVSEYTTTTKSEVATVFGVMSLATGVGGLVTGSALLADVAIGSAAAAFFIEPTFVNGLSLGAGGASRFIIAPKFGEATAKSVDVHSAAGSLIILDQENRK